MKKQLKPFDFLVIIAVLLCAALPLFLRTDKAEVVNIKIEGVQREILSLYRDGTYRFEVADGEVVLRIEDNGIQIEHSPCQDKLCVHMGVIKKAGQPIVCLPEQFVAEIAGSSEVDAYAG